MNTFIRLLNPTSALCLDQRQRPTSQPVEVLGFRALQAGSLSYALASGTSGQRLFEVSDVRLVVVNVVGLRLESLEVSEFWGG